MALIRTRTFARRGLGDLPAAGTPAWHDAYLAVANGPGVDWFPNGAPANAMYRLNRDGGVYINQGDSDNPNWASITDAFYGATEDQKAALAIKQGLPVENASAAYVAGPVSATGAPTAVLDPSRVAYLQSLAATDPLVQTMHDQSAAGNPPSAANQAFTANLRHQDYVNQAKQIVANDIAGGMIFLDTIPKGEYLSDSYLLGMQTTQEYEDGIVAKLEGTSYTAPPLDLNQWNSVRIAKNPVPVDTPVQQSPASGASGATGQDFQIANGGGVDSGPAPSSNPFGDSNPGQAVSGGGLLPPDGPAVDVNPGSAPTLSAAGLPSSGLLIGGVVLLAAFAFLHKKKK